MDGLLENTLLYDFYGELLTGHQREIYEDFVLNDLSLGEIAQNNGISRQGVYDIVRRCKKQLMDYENKLRLVDKFMKAREVLAQIESCAQDILKEPGSMQDAEKARQICSLTATISEQL